MAAGQDLDLDPPSATQSKHDSPEALGHEQSSASLQESQTRLKPVKQSGNYPVKYLWLPALLRPSYKQPEWNSGSIRTNSAKLIEKSQGTD